MRAEARRLYGLNPVGYEAGRPEYPERVYEILTARCGLTEGAHVLEIGPGTGRVTRRLLAVGADVVAVEPDDAAAAHLSDVMDGEAVEVIVGSFEDAPLPDRPFDLAVAAMSFHWVDQDVGLPKLGRVIRPGGWVALWWTVFGDPTRPDPFREATRELLGEAELPAAKEAPPQFELDVGERRLDLARRAGLVDVEGELIRWTTRMDSNQVRALHASMIRILRRDQHEQQRLLDALVAITEKDFGGSVERPFVTALYTAHRP
jgi:SAM-dependent methyltransferase